MEESTPLRRMKKFNLFSFRTLGWLFILLSIIIALGVWTLSKKYYDDLALRQFESNVYVNMDRIHKDMSKNEHILHSCVGLLNLSDEITRQDWHAFVQELDLKKNYPGLQGIGISMMLKPEEVRSFEAKMRSSYDPAFTVFPSGQREEYSSIMYLEPMDIRNKQAIGYDMLTDATRKNAMYRARDTGDVILSGRVILKQEMHSDIQAGIIMYHPLYKKGAQLNTLEQRRNALIGFVGSVFRMNDLMSKIIVKNPKIDFEIYDDPQMSEKQLLYRSFKPSKHHSKYHSHQKLSIAGRVWYLNFYSTPTFDDETDNIYPFLLTTAGLFLYFILLTVIFILIKNKRLLEDKNHMLDVLQEKIRKNERRLQTIIDNEPECVKVVNNRGQLIEMNSAGLSMLEADTLQEAQQYSLTDYLLPQGRESFIALHKKVMDGQSGILEFEVKGLKGTYRWLETHAAPLRNEQGEVTALLGITRDITEKKESDARVQESIRFYHAIFSSVNEAIFILEDNFVVDCNEKALILLNKTKEEIVGNHIQNPNQKFETPLHSFDEYLKTAKEGVPITTRCSLTLTGTSNEYKITEISISNLGDSHHNRLMLTVRDLTKQLEEERLLLTNIRQAQMGEMISIIAHQWRQPLTIVNTVIANTKLQALMQDSVNTSLIDNLAEIEKQTLYMSQTISDFRDFFRPETSKELVSLSHIVNHAVNLVDHVIKKSNINVIQTIHHDPQLLIKRNEVLQVIIALLKNSFDSFQHNHITDPQITISVDQTPEYGILIIQDNAGGIHPAVIENIFLPYYTTKTSTLGTGLGLSMSKIIIEEHCNGLLDVESEDQYTTLTIKIPLQEQNT